MSAEELRSGIGSWYMYRGATVGRRDEQRGYIWGDFEAKRQAGRAAAHGVALGWGGCRWAGWSVGAGEGGDRDICAFDAELVVMSSSSGTTVQRSSSTTSSTGSSNEPMRDRVEHPAGWHPPPQLRHAELGTPRNTTVSNRNASSEIQKCPVTGFVNFVEAQPSVGRFKVDDQEPPGPRNKLTDVLVPTIAPECNYGVFTTHDNDLRHG